MPGEKIEIWEGNPLINNNMIKFNLHIDETTNRSVDVFFLIRADLSKLFNNNKRIFKIEPLINN